MLKDGCINGNNVISNVDICSSDIRIITTIEWYRELIKSVYFQ